MYKDSIEEYFCDMYEEQGKQMKENAHQIINEFYVDDIPTLLLRHPEELPKLVAALMEHCQLKLQGVTRAAPGYSFTTYSVVDVRPYDE